MAEGFRRLAILGGALATVAWGFYVVARAGPRDTVGLLFGIALIGGGVVFGAAWAFIRAVGWVVQGFTKPPSN